MSAIRTALRLASQYVPASDTGTTKAVQAALAADPTCSDCDYYRKGECRRIPPFQMDHRYTGTARWPKVPPDGWCHEHR